LINDNEKASTIAASHGIAIPLLLQGEHPEILAGIGVEYGKVAFGVYKSYTIYLL